jgi:DNA-binding SARP family transcriptional activator/predicted ATPase
LRKQFSIALSSANATLDITVALRLMHSARRQKRCLNRYNTITRRVSGSIRPNRKRIVMIGPHHPHPSLELRVFGTPRLLLDQRDVPFRRRQPLAIMAVLALSERSVTRDELTYLLWPDSPQTVGRQRLRRLLSQLRQSVGPLADRLLTGEAGIGSGVIRFDASMCRVDAREFVRLSGQARTLPDPDGLRAAEQAARLYAGPLLSGLELDESPEFEHWLLQQRERFERMHLDVWLRLIDGYASTGDFDRAIAAVEHALVLDPLSEMLHRKAMWLYAKTGRRSDAIRQFTVCTALLERELALEPDADTAALYRAILNNQLDAARSLAFRDQSLPSAIRISTGRAEHTSPATLTTTLTADLVGATRTALTGSVPVVVVQGPAGSGKTRMVRQALDQIRQTTTNLLVWLSGARRSGQQRPFGVMIDLLDTALRERLNHPDAERALPTDVRMTEAVRVLPELRAVFLRLQPIRQPTEESPSSHHLLQRRLLQALPRAVHALAGGEPVIVALEDLDQADPLSIEAVAWLARSLHGTNLALVITCRTAEGALKAMLSDLRARGMLQSLTLTAFDHPTVIGLARHAGLPTTTAEQIWRQTGGAPLATREMVRAMVAAGKDLSALPLSLHEAIQIQLKSLAPTIRQVMEAAAVLQSGDALEIQQVSGRTADEVEHACEELQARDWLMFDGTRYIVAHPEVQEAVLESLSPARRQRLHRQAALVMRQHNADPARIASHLESADQPDEAAAMWLQAARRARSLYARDAALTALQCGLGLVRDRHVLFELLSEQESILHEHGLRDEQRATLETLERFVEQSPDHPDWRAEVYRKRGRLALACNEWNAAIDALRRAAVFTLHSDWATLCLLARALGHNQQWREADEILQRALALAQQQRDREAQARCWLTRADIEQGRERFDAAESALKHAVHLIEPSSPTLPQLMLNLGNMATVRNDFVSALTYGQEAQRLFAQRGAPDSEAAAWVLVARMHARLGQFEAALAAYQSAYAGYAALELRQGMAAARINACTLALRIGNFDHGLRLAEEAWELFQAINDARGMCVTASNRGAALVWMGRGAEAESWLRESYERAVAIPLPAQQAAALANLGAALLQQGRLEEARQAMEQGLALRVAQGHIDVSVDRAFLAIACLRLGDIEAADRYSLEAVEYLARAPQVENPQQVWFARAQVLRAQGLITEANNALQSAVECLYRSEQQLPPPYRERYRSVFSFNRAILHAFDSGVWPEPPMLV